MRRPAILLLMALAACGSTQASTSSGIAGDGSTGGGQRTPCQTNRDCALGICGTDHFCESECSTDSDCPSADERCNEQQQCVPRPAMSSSSAGASSGGSSSTGAGSTSGRASSSTAGSTTGRAVTSSSSAGSTSSGSTGRTSSSGAGSTTSRSSTASSSAAGTTTGGTTTGGTTTGGSTTGGTTRGSSSGGGGSTAGSTTGGGRCISGSCPSGKACDFASGQCVNAFGTKAIGSTCTTVADCQSGYCQAFADGTHRCSQSCSGSTQCPSGYLCAGQEGIHANGSGICVADTGIGGGAIGSTCTSGSTTECHSVYPCLGNGTCTDTCGRDSDCGGGGLICVESPGPASYRESYCGADVGGSGFNVGCSSDDECASGICDTSGSNHFCSENCCTDSDCPAGTCLPVLDPSGDIYRACVDSPSNASTALGGSCDPHDSSTCVSGYCMPYDPTNPGTTSGYCTTTCCRDSDCAAVSNAHCILEDNHLRYGDGGSAGLMGVCVKR